MSRHAPLQLRTDDGGCETHVFEPDGGGDGERPNHCTAEARRRRATHRT